MEITEWKFVYILMFVMLLRVYIHTGQAEKFAWPRWESNITNIIFTWVHNTNTHKNVIYIYQT
jgi:hypothetical protein